MDPSTEKKTVVCWKWKSPVGYRSKFEAVHVNVFARMVRRNYPKPVEVVCITDDPAGISECDRVLPLWDEFSDIPSPMNTPGRPNRNPSCYRRLRMFEEAAADWLGTRIVSIDLDCVVTGDLSPILDRTEPFIAWGDTNPRTFYNGGLIAFDAGARAHLYHDFQADPAAAIQQAVAARHFGSDQGWISARLGPGEAKFTVADGVWSYRNHVRVRPRGTLPPGARLVMFHGQFDPWDREPQSLGWVREHWR